MWQENTAEVGAKDGYTLKVKARGNAPRIASPKKDMKTKPHLRMWQHGTMEYTKWVPEEATVCRSMQWEEHDARDKHYQSMAIREVEQMDLKSVELGRSRPSVAFLPLPWIEP